jgi:hypothetical protein
MPKPAITTFSSLAVNQSPTNKDNGLYAPELTQEQIDAIPADTLRNGAIVYNITESSFEIYEDGDWENINTTGGDVEGPDGAINNNIPVFDGITGKIIRESGVPIASVPLLCDEAFRAMLGLRDDYSVPKYQWHWLSLGDPDSLGLRGLEI